MRKFYTLLLLVFFALSSTLQARNLDQAVERAVAVRTEQAKTRPTHSKAQKTPSQDIQTWYKLPVISWQQYEELSKQAIQKQEKMAALLSRFTDELLKAGLADQMTKSTLQQGTPAYEQIVKNVPYIYIGEYHNTPVVQQEIQKLLKAIRKANPSKKILLATEFLQNFHPLINPLHKDGQEWLIREVLGDYGIPALADELHIDTLALDDYIIQIVGSVSLLKVGDRYIKVSLASNPKARSLIAPFKENIKENVRIFQTDTLGTTLNFLSQPAQIENFIARLRNKLKDEETANSWFMMLASQYGQDNLKYLEALAELQDSKLSPLTPQQATAVASAVYLLNSIQASTWGVLQRNYQWAKRIKEVEKNYDIVIVWGGKEHLDSTITSDIPYLLGHPEAIQFSFEPIDMFDATDEDSLLSSAERSEKLLNQKLTTCAQAEVDPEQIMEHWEKCSDLESIDLEQTYFSSILFTKNSAESEALLSPKLKALLASIEQLDPDYYDVDDLKAYYSIFLR